MGLEQVVVDSLVRKAHIVLDDYMNWEGTYSDGRMKDMFVPDFT